MMILDSAEQKHNLRECVIGMARGLGFDASEESFARASVLVGLRREIEGARLIQEYEAKLAEAAAALEEANRRITAIMGPATSTDQGDGGGRP